MADIITTPDGRNTTVFDVRDFMELMDRYMGPDAVMWFEDQMGELIEEVVPETELERVKSRNLEVMLRLREQSEIIAKLIREKDIDRKALSNAAGRIGIITWREMNV